jgi:UDP-N-acetylglucosamine:LPS N-acetylglucosamine transferase
VGGGHESIAYALAAAAERRHPGTVVAKPVDVYLRCSRFPVTLVPTLYGALVRRHPLLWSMLFRLTNTPSTCDVPALNHFLSSGIAQLLLQERPDVIVSVLPLVNRTISKVISKLINRPRFSVFITEWSDIHRSWIAPGTDHYLVPTFEVKSDCIRYGVEPSKIDVVGFPVRGGFLENAGESSRNIVLSRLGLEPDTFTILFMVGGEGSPHSIGAIRNLLNLPLGAQVIVVCGRDKDLFDSIRGSRSRMKFSTLSFVHNIAELMRCSDLLVTKAGASTLAEAFAVGIPVIVNDVVPGQEAGNVRFAASRDAVWVAESPQRLGGLIVEAMGSPAKCADLRAKGRALSSAGAAQAATAAVFARLEAARG